MGTIKGLELGGIQDSRRGFVRRAAGLGLALPAFGGIVMQSNAQEEPPASSGHGGHAMVTSTGAPPEGFKLYDPWLAPVEAGPKEITVVAKDATFSIAKDTTFAGWTFDGTIPGPTLACVEGDTINFTFKVDPAAIIGHSLDFHSAKTAPDVNLPHDQPG